MTIKEMIGVIFEGPFWVGTYNEPTPVTLLAVGTENSFKGGGGNTIIAKVKQRCHPTHEFVAMEMLHTGLESCKQAMLQAENDRHTKATVAIVASKDTDA